MRPDIVNLRQFYSSRLGRKVRRRLRRLVRHYWPHEDGLHSVGVGYTTHLLPLPNKADSNARTLALMPTVQGAIYWPIDDSNHSILADDMRPPFMPSSLHRVLFVHGFEHVDAPDECLRVWWQLLTPGGRLMLIVPNRHGLWSRFGSTPFARGNAYRFTSLRSLLNEAGFTVRDMRSALFAPPSTHPFCIACFAAVEWLGMAFFPRIGGVLLIEAEKQIYAGIREPLQPAKSQTAWAANATAMSSPRDN
ncbi:MAG: class I SAM-dependent methyltransferase [Rickettsiales bacterium]